MASSTANPTGALVNSSYPLSYFSLAGVNPVEFPDKFWWSSKERFASVDSTGYNYASAADGGVRTSEILEIDLGRVREINYINFDVIRAPIDITVEYDAISTPDREPIWHAVAPSGDLPFEDGISFFANMRSGWQNVEFNFTNDRGSIVHARYLRISFTRRDEGWPTATAAPFPWPVFVKHLRVGRYIAELLDTVGPLLNQDTPNGPQQFTVPLATNGIETTEVRQQFVIPANSVRSGQTPNLLGFGVLLEDSGLTDANQLVDTMISLGWSLYDVTNAATPIQLATGTVGPYEIAGQDWVDFYLDESKIITGSTSKIYELRVKSLNAETCDIFYTHSPNGLSATSLPGTLTFTNGSVTVNTSSDLTSVLQPGQYIIRTDIIDQPLLVNAVTSTTLTLSATYPGASATITATIVYPFSSWNGSAYAADATRNLICRVWSDIADEGEDVLGNAYRYIVRRQQAGFVTDSTKAGWMSRPVPTPEAVEALYFDVRGTDSKTKMATWTLIEAMEIAPRTPGVRMNVYYTQEGLNGNQPVKTEEWDNLLWTPVHATYTLRRDEIIRFPHPFKASFIKLEFTSLNPLPYRLPNYPPLPPVQYRRYPTWVETQFQNSQLKSAIEDWFLRNATPVEQKVLQDLADPVQEYVYAQSVFLAQLALGTITDQQTIASGLVDVADKALIDPTTGSKIYLQTPDQFGSPLVVTVDQNSVLGAIVTQNTDPTLLTQPVEAQNPTTPGTNIPVVSTTNDRVAQSYQSLAQTPMRFNKTARHIYTTEEAQFNKKAYFVGIDMVRFLRIDYGKAFDDQVMVETLYDDTLLIEDTFQRDTETTIPDGATVYVSYEVGETQYFDEPAVLSGFQPYELLNGGSPVRNVVVFQFAGGQGIQYFQGMDYELGYGEDESGNLRSSIERSALTERLSVPIIPLVYQDAYTVVGHGNIPETTLDAATVVSVGHPTGADGVWHTELTFTVVSRGVVTGNDTDPPKDTFVVVGVGKTTVGSSDTHERPTYGAGDYGTGDYGNLGESVINP